MEAIALMESVAAPEAGRACSSGGGKKECWEKRKGRSQGGFPELDTDTELLLTSSCLGSPAGFLRASLSTSLSRSEPDTVPVVVSRSVPLVVLTSSRSLPSDASLTFALDLPSPYGPPSLDSLLLSSPGFPWAPSLLAEDTMGRAGGSRGPLGSFPSWPPPSGLFSRGLGGSSEGRGYSDGGKMPGKPCGSAGKAGPPGEKGSAPGWWGRDGK
uniref:Uncharacterized protein n=1 Tax=Paramormyrops kingsleyae TaxID=1676925 RepID=A0A3B3SUY3_9TELE